MELEEAADALKPGMSPVSVLGLRVPCSLARRMRGVCRGADMTGNVRPSHSTTDSPDWRGLWPSFLRPSALKSRTVRLLRLPQRAQELRHWFLHWFLHFMWGCDSQNDWQRHSTSRFHSQERMNIKEHPRNYRRNAEHQPLTATLNATLERNCARMDIHLM